MGVYYRPYELSELFDRLSQGKLTLLAGGTDYYPAKVGKVLDDDVLDISAVQSLRGIEQQPGVWRIGATTTWSDIIAADLPPVFDGLKAAAKEIGGRQIQNAGTVGGNICNASPAADGVPALLSLGAEVEFANRDDSRRIALGDFILGNRRTILSPSDVVTAFYIPQTDTERSRGDFLKLGSRKYLVISLAMVAGTVMWDEDSKITDCKIAVGACSEVAQRLEKLEVALVGAQLSETLSARVKEDHFKALFPIDDVRATSEYRLNAAQTLVKRLLDGWGLDHGI